MRAILHFLVLVLRCAPAFFRSRSEQAIVELTLRQQLATCSQKNTKPKITPLDRVFWVALFQFWPRWKQSLVIVKPDTVVRWHRKGFRLYWRWISKPGPGRPAISLEIRTLIRAFALDNGWGARKIHAELGKLGFTVSPGRGRVAFRGPERAPSGLLARRPSIGGAENAACFAYPQILNENPGLRRPSERKGWKGAQKEGVARF